MGWESRPTATPALDFVEGLNDRDVYDVVGAGDTVTAYLAATLASGATRLASAFNANVAAAIDVGKVGAATLTAAEVVGSSLDHVIETG